MIKKLIKSLICLACMQVAAGLGTVQAQIVFQPTEGGINGEATSYIMYGSDGLSNRIPYHKIKGSAFWSDVYHMAVLYSGPKRISVTPIKLNLATNEIYFLKNGEELVLDAADITRITIHEGTDTTTASTTFIRRIPHLFVRSEEVENFVQVLNTGKYELLKFVKRKVGSADSLFRTQKKYFFTDEVHYFLRSNAKVEKIKKLNQEELLSFLPQSLTFSEWIRANKINFKKEVQVIQFLNFYNLKKQEEDPMNP